MKTRMLSLIIFLVVLGGIVFAANGDLNVSGKVGISTTTPAKKLDVIEPSNTWALRATRQTPGTTGLGGAAEFVIQTSGDMVDGFGTGIMLSIQDNAAGPNYIGGVYAAREGDDTSGKLHFLTRNGANWDSRMVIDKLGNVGIGTQLPGGYKLYINGVTFSYSGYQSSDLKFKTNITPIDSPLQKILQIDSVAFNWKTEEYQEKDFPEGRHYGMIADDVEKVLPEVIKEGTNGEKGIAYAEIVPVLIEAIKELQKQIDQLKSVPQTSVK